MKKSASQVVQKPAHSRRFACKATQFARSIWENLDTPTCIRLLGLLKSGNLRDVVTSAIDPSSYTDAEDFRRDYLAVSLMSKYPSWDVGIDRSAVALRSFLESERSCSDTNLRLVERKSYVNGLLARITPESVLSLARRKIAHCLGPFSWDKSEAFFAFGPGATTSVPNRKGDPYFKYGEKPRATQDCALLAYTALIRVPRWFHHVVSLTGYSLDQINEMPLGKRLETLIEIVPGNRVCFVPKDARKDRSIAIEPTMNGYIQHGIGGVIRQALRRVPVGGGDSATIDLDDQSRNQRLALAGSLDGSLATLDLSAASDSLSLELIHQLLPEDWFAAIAATRSRFGHLPDGTLIEYSKVSSMGNGFTFELESLVFWALCRAVVDLLCLKDRRVSVYGDDLIVPVDAAHTVTWILEFCGFKLNGEKSYSTGVFRESCGKHYFRGCDVTPIYIRKDIDTPARLIWLANQIRRWSRLYWGLDATLEPVYRAIVASLPPSLRRPTIPDGCGDFALFGDFDEVRPQRASFGVEGWYAQSWVPIVKAAPRGDLPYLLRQLAGRSEFNPDPPLVQLQVLANDYRKRKLVALESTGVPIPASERWHLCKKMLVRSWSNFGPWLTAEA
nr:MAG: RNA-dependent RNA polymerase [Riboviria sp.]